MNPNIRVFAIWEPILPTDYSMPGTAVLARLFDPRVAQYWDKNHLFADQLAYRMESDAGDPRPNCCMHKGVQWDEVAVYPQNARWDEQLPGAVFLNGPVVRSLDFSKTVTDLLSMQNTGPK
jgi:hypothetical protein